MAFKKRSAARYFMLQNSWGYALLVAAGLGIGTYAISSYQAVSRFALEGIDSAGLATHKSDYTRGGNRRGYRLSYTYPTPVDPYTHGTQDVSETLYNAQTEDAEIVVHLPSDPSVSVVEPAGITKGFWLGLVSSIGLVLGGIAGGVYGMSRAHACVRQREIGETRTATVTSHKTKGKKQEIGHMLWRDASGIEGRTLTSPLAKLLAAGTSITIFTDPERRLGGVGR